jgi:dTDP-4-dehydrorhamnose 3,5-epimerase-like enzyme
MSSLPNLPTIFQGNRATDDRGSLGFINGFGLSDFKRFYTVSNHSSNFVRAWHGHLKEAKAIIVLQGSALVCAVEMNDSKNPNRDNPITRHVLSGNNPGALYIPAGYANGFKTLTSDAIVLVFSSTTLEESMGDDYRFEYDYWNPWEVVPR